MKIHPLNSSEVAPDSHAECHASGGESKTLSSLRQSHSQKRLLAFLQDPNTYPDHPQRIQMRQTHSSWVFLTKRYAYKVKKPVDFGFLDFSTLEKRRYFCEREILLNGRLCADLYIGLVPICLRNGCLNFDSEGRVVEYALKMKRLPARFFMLGLLERDMITKRDIDAVIRKLKPFYECQNPTSDITTWGGASRLKISTDENFRQTREFVGVTIARPVFEAVRFFTNTFYHRHASLFAMRVRDKRIRDCHGDLHLDHIHCGPAGLTIYDCIEFNDRFRYIDVANEVAFLAMDFDFHGRPDLSRYFVSRMARVLRDPLIGRLLDFYKCYRAYVRGKVESLNYVAPETSELEQRQIRLRAERYFKLALQYAACGSTPMVLIVMGKVATGKTTLACSLGQQLGWRVFSSDRIRKRFAGVSLHVRGGKAARSRLYSKKMTTLTYDQLAKCALQQIRGNGGVILDATFGSREQRKALRSLLDRKGIKYCFIVIRAAAPTIKRRLIDRDRSEGEISDARLEDYLPLSHAYEQPVELDTGSFFSIKTAETVEKMAAAALKQLVCHRMGWGPH